MPPAAFDRRTTPARRDLAAEHLRGLIDAPRYAIGEAKRIIAASAPLRGHPDPSAPLETEALHGESVTIFDAREGWAWAQLDRDQYVGYLPLAAVGAPSESTHRVAALRAHAYPGPSIKLPPRFALSLGARLTIADYDGDFAVSEDGLFVWARHLAESGSSEPDYVAVAERFLETPYLWGGRTSEGIDCSGLVQTALTAAEVAAPRDSDMQEAGLGGLVAIDDPRTPLKRGDFVFWKGHVGIMRDSVTLLHANGWHMKVVSEPLSQARDRIARKGGGKVTSVRRLPAPRAPLAGRVLG
jgi:cell wall-associated NlpC family hydrolase